MTSKKSRNSLGQASGDRGIIGLGDLMRALKGLNASDPKTIGRIARSLGFSGFEANPVEAVQGVSGARPRPALAARARSRELPHPIALPPMAPPPALPHEILEMDMQRAAAPPAPADPPAWFHEGPPLDEATVAAAPRASLFPRRSAKGVLTAAVATRRPGPVPDIPRLIRALTRGHDPAEIPFRPRPSLHRGVQLLMDTSEAMMPFLDDLDDLDDLATMLTAVVGRHACELYEFAGDPNEASRWSADFQEIRWRPVNTRPVVVASDLGIGARAAAQDRAGLDDWQRLAQKAQESGVPVIAFVPYGRDRWPKTLTRRIHFVHWDPRTRASQIRNLFGIGHAVEG